MPCWRYTTAILNGPEDEIERFKRACLFVKPVDGGDNGLDFERVLPMSKWGARVSVYHINEKGCHELYLVTAHVPLGEVFEKIVAMFPALTLNVTSGSESGFFLKGTISASGTDLHNDEEETKRWEAAVTG
jgi:hypothetical protein